ncbi:MAG TPA: Rrf2 family transcriptional regulator [Chromatiales bacterium]|nr:Rrf2 family transcriptional regulator [Thiotrichales bacterium]HIP67658.1 Rrf2 family transcriptional regulator [Chromatiales bacterium]
MKLTTKGRYAVTAMLDLALHNDNSPVTLNDIAGRQGLSLSYLEQLFARLRRNGLVTSTRGPGGGYSLSRVADEIAVSDVISAVDEKVDSTRCGGNTDCQDQKKCLTHDLWCDLSDQIQQFLAGISLGDLMQRGVVQEVAARQDKLLKVPVTVQNANA